MSNQRGKYWCYTLNNYTEEELKDHREAHDKTEDITYHTFGREKGDENATPHLQGYIEFKAKIRLGGIKRIPGFKRCHLELRRGSAEQARDYCWKEDDSPHVSGELSNNYRGKRSDLLAIKDKIDAGATEEDIASEHFGSWVRYRKSFSAYKALKVDKSRIRTVKVYVLYGLPGTGKTRYAFERECGQCWISSDPTLQWFDGYRGERAVILDDYRGDARGSLLLRLLDIYPMLVPIKGGFVPWTPERIYITSNMEVPFGHHDVTEPLRRRITKSFHFVKPLNFDDEKEIDQVNNYLQ